MIHRYRLTLAAVAQRLLDLRHAMRSDDRGEISSSLYWSVGMLLLAIALVGIISGKAKDFANAIDFGQ